MKAGLETVPKNYSFFPLATSPRKRKGLGYFPSPQILNDPKSLYPSPSGTSGSDSRHIFGSYFSVELLNRCMADCNESVNVQTGRFPVAQASACGGVVHPRLNPHRLKPALLRVSRRGSAIRPLKIIKGNSNLVEFYAPITR